jgi:hypothetical protein
VNATELAELRDAIARRRLKLAGTPELVRSSAKGVASVCQRCVYCGDSIGWQKLTCVKHEDLPALDPKYAQRDEVAA